MLLFYYLLCFQAIPFITHYAQNYAHKLNEIIMIVSVKFGACV